MTYGGEVGADLVGAAGNEPDFQQRANIPRFSMVEILLYLVSMGTALSFCFVMIVT